MNLPLRTVILSGIPTSHTVTFSSTEIQRLYIWQIGLENGQTSQGLITKRKAYRNYLLEFQTVIQNPKQEVSPGDYLR